MSHFATSSAIKQNFLLRQLEHCSVFLQLKMSGSDPPRSLSAFHNTRYIGQRAAPYDLAKRVHEVQFPKFLTDIPKLDDELTYYAAWIYNIPDVCKKKCRMTSQAAALSADPGTSGKLASTTQKC